MLQKIHASRLRIHGFACFFHGSHFRARPSISLYLFVYEEEEERERHPRKKPTIHAFFGLPKKASTRFHSKKRESVEMRGWVFLLTSRRYVYVGEQSTLPRVHCVWSTFGAPMSAVETRFVDLDPARRRQVIGRWLAWVLAAARRGTLPFGLIGMAAGQRICVLVVEDALDVTPEDLRPAARVETITSFLHEYGLCGHVGFSLQVKKHRWLHGVGILTDQAQAFINDFGRSDEDREVDSWGPSA